MHTSKFKVQGKEVFVIHHGDWSGDAAVHFTDEEGKAQEVTLPGLFLLQLGKNAAVEALKAKIMSVVETALDEPL